MLGVRATRSGASARRRTRADRGEGSSPVNAVPEPARSRSGRSSRRARILLPVVAFGMLPGCTIVSGGTDAAAEQARTALLTGYPGAGPASCKRVRADHTTSVMVACQVGHVPLRLRHELSTLPIGALPAT